MTVVKYMNTEHTVYISPVSVKRILTRARDAFINTDRGTYNYYNYYIQYAHLYARLPRIVEV